MTALPRRLAVGDVAPRFELPDTDGRSVELAPGDAEATVIVFTANGCPFARAWHDRIQAVARAYAERGVAALQVVSNDETDHPEDSVTAMAARGSKAGEFARPFLRDADQLAARAYGTTATPEVFVVDGDNVVRYHGAPDGDHDNPAHGARWLRDALDDVLAGREVTRPLHVTRPAARSSGGWNCCGGRAAPPTNQAAELLRATLTELGRERGARGRARGTYPGRRHQRLGFSGFADLPGRPRRPVPRRGTAGLMACRVYTRPDGRSFAAARPRRTSPSGCGRRWPAPGTCPHWVDPRKHATA